MNTQTQAAPRTAPYLAGAVVVAVALIVAVHLMGFHFVVAGGVGH